MSSATSINNEDAERLPQAKAGDPPQHDSRDSLQPWHFFVLLSLIAATAAVVMAREARPEHLVLISITIGAAGFAGAALYRTLAPLVAMESRPADVLTGSMRAVLEREKVLVLRSIKDLEFDRAMGKLSPKDFEEMAGRLRARAMSLMRQLDTEAGYRELIEREVQARLNNPKARARRPASKDPVPTAKSLSPSDVAPGSMDAGSTDKGLTSRNVGPKSSDPGRCTCGTRNDADASFCKRCGAKLNASSGGVQA